MKKTHIVGLAMILAMASCSHKPVTMDSVDSSFRANATAYIEAMANYDIASARPHATEETNNVTLNYFDKAMEMLEDSTFIQQNTPAVIRYDSIVFTSDTSATVYYNKQTPIQNANATLNMRLRNGEWLAHQVIDTRIRISGSPAKQ